MVRDSRRQINNTAIEVGSSAGGAVIGAVAGGMIGGPIGAAVGSYWGTVITPVIEYLAKRMFSPKELERMELVQKLGKKIYDENIRKGCKSREDITEEQFTQLAEGILLTSREAYEEKKIPFLANLIATVPFTSTPIENMMQTLHEAERLSYRQLCLLAIIDRNEYGEGIDLSNLPFIKEEKKHHNEFAEGIYQDLNLMVVDGIIAMIVSHEAGPMMSSGVNFIVPSKLNLLYPGVLLVNGLGLSGVQDDELSPIIKILKVS